MTAETEMRPTIQSSHCCWVMFLRYALTSVSTNRSPRFHRDWEGGNGNRVFRFRDEVFGSRPKILRATGPFECHDRPARNPRVHPVEVLGRDQDAPESHEGGILYSAYESSQRSRPLSEGGCGGTSSPCQLRHSP